MVGKTEFLIKSLKKTLKVVFYVNCGEVVIPML